MIARLYDYFGILGCGSIAVWAAALVVLVRFVRHRQRGRYYLLALALAVIGWGLAVLNSERVSAVRLAEPPLPAAAPTADPGLEAGVPAYRQQGKQQRVAGKTMAVDTGVADETKDPERTFHEAELLEANRLDRWNLFFTRVTLLLALLALGGDYLARFNRTTGHSHPLPIGGHWLDRLFPKPGTVLAGSLDLKAYLETSVRRGETFLYFTAADPWPTATLPRLGKFWRFPKLVYGTPDVAEFYFDAVWFNRYCVVVPAADAPAVFRQLEAYLNWRHFTKATARHTVNIVWDLETAPPETLLRELIPLFREANFKLVVKSATANRELFEEVQH